MFSPQIVMVLKVEPANNEVREIEVKKGLL